MHAEYATFLHPSFDANSFAHSIVNNEPYPPRSADAKPDGAVNGPGPVGGFMKGLGGTGEDGGDVSAALARLNFGVEDLSRQLKGEVRVVSRSLGWSCGADGRAVQITKHHSELLLQAASLGGLDGDLGAVRRGLAEVEGGVARFVPPLSLQKQQQQLITAT